MAHDTPAETTDVPPPPPPPADTPDLDAEGGHDAPPQAREDTADLDAGYEDAGVDEAGVDEAGAEDAGVEEAGHEPELTHAEDGYSRPTAAEVFEKYDEGGTEHQPEFEHEADGYTRPTAAEVFEKYREPETPTGPDDVFGPDADKEYAPLEREEGQLPGDEVGPLFEGSNERDADEVTREPEGRLETPGEPAETLEPPEPTGDEADTGTGIETEAETGTELTTDAGTGADTEPGDAPPSRDPADAEPEPTREAEPVTETEPLAEAEPRASDTGENPPPEGPGGPGPGDGFSTRAERHVESTELAQHAPIGAYTGRFEADSTAETDPNPAGSTGDRSIEGERGGFGETVQTVLDHLAGTDGAPTPTDAAAEAAGVSGLGALGDIADGAGVFVAAAKDLLQSGPAAVTQVRGMFDQAVGREYDAPPEPEPLTHRDRSEALIRGHEADPEERR
ncbi:hypothetical protein Afil01_23200 [Actinorhabdospora filicis]|uniref:Uncharacterized protein n=1 Tax=Actinorhabdospora filicis TaxID=1785913 RepID=A0A9W6W903_9ACTN|nr:hypothetical protein [Actinorhabdospora filicis]GLZ77513.1 hypothetical protein Afil01_23200 [Actinorhabdospora filicis]